MDFAGNPLLEGPLPPSIGDSCPRLQSLVLAGCYRLNGPIPPSLGLCAALETLDLASTMVEGPIPEELCRCASLATLSLSRCSRVEGSLPERIGDLRRLCDLNLGTRGIHTCAGRREGETERIESTRTASRMERCFKR